MAAKAELKADVKQFVEPLKTAEQQVKSLASASKKGASQLRTELRSANKEVEALALAYSKLSAEEKKGDFGRELAKQLRESKKAAAELIDMQGDLRAELKHLASDTSTFDSLAEGFNVLGSVAQTTISAFATITGESEQMKQALGAVVTIQTAMNAVIKIQNALQQQSSLMLGIKRTQELAAAAAIKIKTAAEGKSIVATKAATAAQKIFNAVAYANPYVLLATAILAAGAALVYFATRTKEATAEEKRLQEASEALKNAWEAEASRLAENVIKFRDLQKAWNDLGGDLDAKKKFVEDNADAFKTLGLKVTDVETCERVMVKNSGVVVDAFKIRAKAAAAEAAAIETLTKYYVQMGEVRKKIDAGEDFTQSDLKQFGIDDPSKIKGLKLNSSFTTTKYEVTDQAAVLDAINSAINKQMDDALEQFDKIRNDYNKQLKALAQKEESINLGGNNKNGDKKTSKTPKTRGTEAKKEWDGTLTSIEACNKAISHHEKRLSELKKGSSDYNEQVKSIKQDIVTAAKAKFSLIDTSDLKGMKEARSTIEQILQNLDKDSPEINTYADAWRAADAAIRAAEQSLENLKNGIEEGSLAEASQDVERLSSQVEKLSLESEDGYKKMHKLQTEIAKATAKQRNITIKTKFIENRAQAAQVIKDIDDYEQLIKSLPMTSSAIDEFEAHIENAIANVDVTTKDSIETLERYIKLLNELHNKRVNIEIATNILTGKNIDVDKLTDEIYKKQKSEQEKNAKEYEANVRAEWKRISETTAQGIDEIDTQLQFIEDRKKDLFAPNKNGLGDILPDLKELNAWEKELNNKKWEIELRMKGFSEASIELRKFKKSFDDIKTGMDALTSITDGINSFRDSITKMKEDVEENADGWTQFTDALNVAASFVEMLGGTIQGIITIIDLLGTARQTSAAKDSAATQTEVANSLAKTTASSGEAIADATKEGAKMPFPANIAAIAAGVAAVIAALATITSMKFAEGGVVGGSTTIGDHVVGRLNAGELVLNKRDQNYLYNYIHKRKLNAENNASPIIGKVIVRGTDMEIALTNLSKKKALSGRSLSFKG